MTREVMFRAWNKKKKQMNKPFTLGDICDRVSNDYNVEEYSWIGYSFSEGYFKPYCYEIDDCIFLQFTGLYDKNNQPIFEGDVVSVRLPGTPHNYRFTQLVQFSQGMFHSGNNPLYLMCEVEIIGNLYEHPHLLTSNQGQIYKNK